MRIVLYEPSGRGGICHYTWELAEHLAQAGSDVLLLTTSDYELKSQPRQFRIRYLFSKSWIRHLMMIFAGRNRRLPPPAMTSGIAPSKSGSLPFRQWLRRLRIRLLHLSVAAAFLFRRPDVVHFQWLADREHDLFFMRALRRLGITVIYTAHDVLPLEQDSPEERSFRARLYRVPDRIIVHTETDRQSMGEHFDLPLEKVAVVPHGAYDFRFGRPRTIEKEDARRSLNVPPAMKVILFFGLIKRYKGLEYLVSGFGAVERQVKEAYLLLVGDIYRGDADGYKYYSALLEGLRSRPSIRTVIDYVPIEDIPVYFAAADVVVLPYTRTSQSGVLLAAYGAGKPVIVTHTGGLPEIVESDETGVVVPPCDSDALARAIVSILADPVRAAAMGERARSVSTTTYSWANIALRTMEIYQLASNAQGSRRSARLHGAAPEDLLPDRPRPAGRRN